MGAGRLRTSIHDGDDLGLCLGIDVLKALLTLLGVQCLSATRERQEAFTRPESQRAFAMWKNPFSRRKRCPLGTMECGGVRIALLDYELFRCPEIAVENRETSRIPHRGGSR